MSFYHCLLTDYIGNVLDIKSSIIYYNRSSFQNSKLFIFMQSCEKVSNIIEGLPCSLNNNEILDLGAKCSTEGFTLEKLMQIAKTLFKTDSESCFKFLEYFEKHQLNRSIHKDFAYQPWKIHLYYSLAALALTKALKSNDKQFSDKWQKQFNRYLNLGSNVKTSADKLYQLLHGFNSYYAGDIPKAISNFNRLDQLDQNGNIQSTVAMIGLAQSYFILKKYDRALEYYKKALISNKNLPTKARLGMGYCFYELQKYELAEKCFERIVKLDPTCSQAYMGLAVIKYKSNSMDQYFFYVKKSYILNPNNALVILHLSQHFFLKGDYNKCEKMSRRGLQVIESLPRFLKKDLVNRDDFEAFKARFNNLIGQVYHARNQFDQAKKYYEYAKDKQLKFNEVGLAQTYIQTGSFKEALAIFQNLFQNAKPNELKTLAQLSKIVAYLNLKTQSRVSEESGPNYYYKQSLKYNKYDYEALIEYSVYLNDLQDKKQTLKTLKSALKASEESGSNPKAELLNNVGVALIQEKFFEQAIEILKQGEKALKFQQKQMEQQDIKSHCLHLAINFNKAIALQLNNKVAQAVQIHKSLIKYNKLFVDSYVKLADLYHRLGNKKGAYQTLENGLSECEKVKSQQIRQDKLIAIKGHLHHIDGSLRQAQQSFKKLSKSNLMVYENYYDICLNYENLIKREADESKIKQFCRKNRQLSITFCKNDHYNIFSYMMLVVLIVVDNKITKEQAIKYFNQLKIGEEEFPDITYNYGVYSLLSEDYDNALFCLTRYRQKTKSTKADEYIALAHYLKGDYFECLNMIKKNMTNYPNNLRFRYQYALAHEKRVLKLYEQEKDIKNLKLSTKYLKISKKIYEALARVSVSDYIKTLDNPDMKQKIKNEISKIKELSSDRQRFVESQLTYYANRQREILERQKKKIEEENKKLEQIKAAREKRLLFEQIGSDQQQSQSQKIRRERRKKLEELTLAQSQKANQEWKAMEEQQKERKKEQQEKKKNKTTQSKGTRRTKQKQNNQDKEADQLSEKSEQQFKDELESDQQIQYQESELERRRKKKKKNKDRQRDDDKKKKKKRKRQAKQEESGYDELKSNQNGDENINSDLSNPFDEGVDIKQEDQDDKKERQRQEPRKKEKKKKNEDEDEIDINNFLL